MLPDQLNISRFGASYCFIYYNFWDRGYFLLLFTQESWRAKMTKDVADDRPWAVVGPPVPVAPGPDESRLRCAKLQSGTERRAGASTQKPIAKISDAKLKRLNFSWILYALGGAMSCWKWTRLHRAGCLADTSRGEEGMIKASQCGTLVKRKVPWRA